MQSVLFDCEVTLLQVMGMTLIVDLALVVEEASTSARFLRDFTFLLILLTMRREFGST